MSSLQVDEAASAAVATAPRVTLESMEAKIAAQYYTTADRAFAGCPTVDAMKYLTICVLVMDNGFMVIGESAPASPANFDAELGQKFAYENAIRQLWKLEGYALRDRLAAEAKD